MNHWSHTCDKWFGVFAFNSLVRAGVQLAFWYFFYLLWVDLAWDIFDHLAMTKMCCNNNNWAMQSSVKKRLAFGSVIVVLARLWVAEEFCWHSELLPKISQKELLVWAQFAKMNEKLFVQCHNKRVNKSQWACRSSWCLSTLSIVFAIWFVWRMKLESNETQWCHFQLVFK